MFSIEKKIEKHAQTYYNRHGLNLLYKIFNEIKNENLEKKIKIEKIKEIVFFGIDSILLHLNYLKRHQLINFHYNSENLEEITLTKEGIALSFILRDIKYQNLYNANQQIIKQITKKRLEKKHAQTYYNRHSLNIIYKISSFLKESNKNSISYEELIKFINFSTTSINIHLSFLTRDEEYPLRIPFIEIKNDEIFLTYFGYKISKILKDIKYQSLYNIGSKFK